MGVRRGMAGLPVTGVTGQNTLKIDLGDFRPAGRRGPRPPSMLISFAILFGPYGSLPCGVAPRGLSRLTEMACPLLLPSAAA